MRQKNHISKMRVGILIFFLFPFRCFSQDISGVWVGNMYNDTTQQTIHYELAINDVNGKTNGFSHTTFIIDRVKNIGVKEVKVKEKKDRVFVEDEKFVFDNYTEPSAKGVKMYSFLTLSHNDSSEVLAGMWRTNATREYSPLTGSIFLEKKKKVRPEQTIIVKKLIDLGLADQLAFLHPSIASQNTVAINEKKQNQSRSNPSSSSSANKQPITSSPVKPSAKEGNEKTVAINEQQTVSKNNLSSPVTTTPKPETKKGEDSKSTKNEEINLAAKNKIDTNQGVQPSGKEGNEKTVAINEQQTVSQNNLSSSVTTTAKPEAKKGEDSKSTKNEEINLAAKNKIDTNQGVQPSAKEGNERTVAINEQQQTVSKNNLSSSVTTAPKQETKKRADSKPTKNEEINLAAKNKIDTNQGVQPSVKEGNEKTVSKNNLSSSVTTTPKPEAKIDVKGESNNEVATNEKPVQSQTPTITNNQVSSSVQQKISKNSEQQNIISKGNETDKKVVADNSKTSAENKNEQGEKELSANQKINSTVGKPANDNEKQTSATVEKKNEKVAAVKEEKQNANAAPKSNTEITSPVINKEVTKDFPEDEKKKEVVASASENEPKNEKNSQDVTKQKINSLQPPVVVKPKVVIPPPAAEFSKRKLETIRTVEIAQDSLVFSLYDNGAVDGDTVSVLLNGQVIMPRVGLLVTATSKTIYLTPEMGDSISVVMYAENLGSIPPNTGLLVIHDGQKIYEIRFSGDLDKNSKIILVRKKEN